MSNTSEISSYDTSSYVADGSDALGTCLGIAAMGITGVLAVARWLNGATPEDRAAVEQYRESRRRANLAEVCNRKKLYVSSSGIGRQVDRSPTNRPDLHASGGLREISSVNLHIRDMDALERSAERLGYRKADLPNAALDRSNERPLLLQRKTGERLIIGRSKRGGLVISSVGNPSGVASLVRQHTLDRTLAHLRKAGMQVKTSNLDNGEVQILAREPNAFLRGGSAEIKAQVRKNGDAWVDVNRVKGSRCEEIVSDLAKAVGAEVTTTRRKEAFYELPGEPVRPGMKVQP